MRTTWPISTAPSLFNKFDKLECVARAKVNFFYLDLSFLAIYKLQNKSSMCSRNTTNGHSRYMKTFLMQFTYPRSCTLS